jgi:amino acid transporter
MTTKRHKLGLGSVILLGINSIMGPGIFFLPGKMMALVGPFSLYLYLLAAAAALLIAWCFAECASLFSRGGAAYTYAREAFGEFVGFQVGIMKWISTILASAALTVGFVTILSELFPLFQQPYYHAAVLMAIIAGLTASNLMGTSLLRYINNGTAIAKLLPMLGFIGLGAFYIETTHFSPLLTLDIATDNVGPAAIAIFFAFSGFEGLALASEEISNSKRNLPIAILATLLITAAIYFLIHATLIGILGPSLAHSDLPIAHAIEHIAGEGGKVFVLIIMLIASLGTNIAASFIAPRIAVALAKDSLLPSPLAATNEANIPTTAIVVTAVLTLAVALSGSFTMLATISVVTRFMQYFPTCLAVLVFRSSRPDLRSNFPRIMGPVIPFAALAVIAWMLSSATAVALVAVGGCLLATIPLYWWQKSCIELGSA